MATPDRSDEQLRLRRVDAEQLRLPRRPCQAVRLEVIVQKADVPAEALARLT